MIDDRYILVLNHIVKYCEQISNAHKRFGNNEASFASDEDYSRNEIYWTTNY